MAQDDDKKTGTGVLDAEEEGGLSEPSNEEVDRALEGVERATIEDSGYTQIIVGASGERIQNVVSGKGGADSNGAVRVSGKSRIVISGFDLLDYSGIKLNIGGVGYKPVNLQRSSAQIVFNVPNFNKILGSGDRIYIALKDKKSPGKKLRLNEFLEYDTKEQSEENADSGEASPERAQQGTAPGTKEQKGLGPAGVAVEAMGTAIGGVLSPLSPKAVKSKIIKDKLQKAIDEGDKSAFKKALKEADSHGDRKILDDLLKENKRLDREFQELLQTSSSALEEKEYEPEEASEDEEDFEPSDEEVQEAISDQERVEAAQRALQAFYENASASAERAFDLVQSAVSAEIKNDPKYAEARTKVEQESGQELKAFATSGSAGSEELSEYVIHQATLRELEQSSPEVVLNYEIKAEQEYETARQDPLVAEVENAVNVEVQDFLVNNQNFTPTQKQEMAGEYEAQVREMIWTKFAAEFPQKAEKYKTQIPGLYEVLRQGAPAPVSGPGPSVSAQGSVPRVSVPAAGEVKTTKVEAAAPSGAQGGHRAQVSSGSGQSGAQGVSASSAQAASVAAGATGAAAQAGISAQGSIEAKVSSPVSPAAAAGKASAEADVEEKGKANVPTAGTGTVAAPGRKMDAVGNSSPMASGLGGKPIAVPPEVAAEIAKIKNRGRPAGDVVPPSSAGSAIPSAKPGISAAGSRAGINNLAETAQAQATSPKTAKKPAGQTAIAEQEPQEDPASLARGAALASALGLGGDTAANTEEKKEEDQKEEELSGPQGDEEAEEGEKQQQEEEQEQKEAAAEEALLRQQRSTEKAVENAAKLLNKYVNSALLQAAEWIWGAAIPSFGLSVILGAFIGDFIWAFKGFIIKQSLRKLGILKNPRLKARVDDIAKKVEISRAVKLNILGMNSVVVGGVLVVLIFVVATFWYICNNPLYAPMRIVGGLSEYCDAINNSSIGMFANRTVNTVAPGANFGNGTCIPVPAGPASVANLSSTCFGANASMASSIANAESSGRPDLPSGVDKCTGDGSVVSFGLYQINISAHKIGSLNCPAAFDRMFTGSQKNCRVIDQALYNQCVAAVKDPSLNISEACKISSNGTHWGAWGANRKCGFPN